MRKLRVVLGLLVVCIFLSVALDARARGDPGADIVASWDEQNEVFSLLIPQGESIPSLVETDGGRYGPGAWTMFGSDGSHALVIGRQETECVSAVEIAEWGEDKPIRLEGGLFWPPATGTALLVIPNRHECGMANLRCSDGTIQVTLYRLTWHFTYRVTLEGPNLPETQLRDGITSRGSDCFSAEIAGLSPGNYTLKVYETTWRSGDPPIQKWINLKCEAFVPLVTR